MGQLWKGSAARTGLRSPVWPRSTPPTALPEQRLQILAGRDQQGLDVHLPEPAELEPPQTVPVLRFAKQRLDPDLAFAHRTFVGGCLVVLADILWDSTSAISDPGHQVQIAGRTEFRRHRGPHDG